MDTRHSKTLGRKDGEGLKDGEKRMKTDGFSVLASSVVLAVCGTHL